MQKIMSSKLATFNRLFPSLKRLGLIAALGAGGSTLGCAHDVQEKIDNKVTATTDVNSNAQLRTQTVNLISTAPGLSDKQRGQLLSLQKATKSESDALWSESLKLRSILIKDLVAANYSELEVRLVEERIRKNEDKRLSVMFAAVEKAKSILGYETIEDRERIMDLYIDRQQAME